MLVNYIITAWRSLLKNKFVSIINIGGLTIGLASAVLAILFAQHELSYEDMHKNADRVCRVYISGDFESFEWIPNCYGPDGHSIKALFPEIEKSSSMYTYYNTVVRVDDNIFYERNVYAANKDLFDILTFSFKEGAPSDDLNTVVISESVAHRYFGDKDPIGNTMNVNLYGEKQDFVVTGIFEEFSSNTHLEVDFIFPFDIIRRHEGVNPEEYQGTSFNTYLLLRPGVDCKRLSDKIESTYKIPVEIENIKAFLIPLKEIHIRGTFENSKGKLIVFLVGGLFVLIITSLNYINLTNILFSTRNKEIGIRKVIGARRKNIVIQFITDTILSTVIAFNLAILVIKLALPWFNSIMDTNIQIGLNPITFMLLMSILFLTILVSGIYPALRYSFSKPVSLIKPVSNALGSKGYSRWVLTTFQFFLAIIFIQTMLAMNEHTGYITSDDYKLYNSEDVLCLSGTKWGDLNKVKEELLKNPIIESVSWGSAIPEYGVSLSSDWKESDNKSLASIYNFEADYTQVFKIPMLEGRFFSDEYPSDKENAVVINKMTATILGYDQPIGETVMVRGEQYEIIGVIDAYRAVPPIFDLVPVLIRTGNTTANYLTIRINPLQRENAHEYITKTLKTIDEGIPVELTYHYDMLFSTSEAKSYLSAALLLNLFFILTIITSLVGLFGLSLFIAERNRRVVGIRKVFGASIFSIMLKLSKGIVIQVLIAIILATPVSMMLITGYLSVFPGRFQVGIVTFLTGGLVAMVLVLLTVGRQTWVAATSNPAESLKCE